MKMKWAYLAVPFVAVAAAPLLPAGAAAPPPKDNGVLVINDETQPVPVAVGSMPAVTVASLPAVTVASLPAVTVESLPAVPSGDVTELVLAERYVTDQVPPCNSSVVCMSIESDVIDVSAYKTLRIHAASLCDGPPFDCTSLAGEIFVTMESEIPGSHGDIVLAYAANSVLDTVIDTPGTAIHVRTVCNPGPCAAFEVQVVGRSN
jgi:hypothetical protein